MLESGASFFEKCLLSRTYVDFNVDEVCNAGAIFSAAQITLLNIRDVRSIAIDNVFPF